MSRTKTTLAENWEWKLASGKVPADIESSLQTWKPAQSSPSEIHLELLNEKLIPDPNIGLNERYVQWVGEADWLYRSKFDVAADTLAQDHVELVFEGLDTFATVTLNGKQILVSDNMFLPQRVDVKSVLKQSNEIEILFESACRKGTELEKKYGKKETMIRDSRRMHIRKAQYHWGWDWGPILVTSGPYMPIHLESYKHRIDNIFVEQQLAADHSSAAVTATINLPAAFDGTIEIEILSNDNTVAKETLQAKGESASFKTTIEKPALWWPNGHGPQNLYKVRAKLLDGSTTLDELSSTFGIRTIEIIQRPLDNAPGTTFLFSVNGRDIFSQGGDWIPADNLLPRLTRDKYYDWIKLAKRSRLNMIRVWGGGIYETEDFYDACDEHGILVWQDYAFACGNFATYKEYLDSVDKELRSQTIRLRNRASLAILCGGNEDFLLKDWTNVEYDHDDMTGPFDNTNFPERVIYLDVIPKVAKSLAPGTFYWPNSPFGGPTANDLTVGDVHQWEVWHLKQLPYQDYHKLAGRFMSEFGMHGYPDMRTVNEFAPDPAERYPQSKTIDCHNKGHGAETRIARYLAENFRYSQDFEHFAYASQLLQSEAYGYALRDFMRQFGGKGKELCAGAIIWQFNDVYPVTSWAYADYYLRPKPSFYTIRRAYGPVSVGVDRTPRSRWIDDDHPRETEVPTFAVFGYNNSPDDATLTLVVKAYDLTTKKYIAYPEESRKVVLKGGHSTELGDLKNPELSEDSLIILSATLIDEHGPVARWVNWPEPYRYLEWPKDTKVTINVEKKPAMNGSSNHDEYNEVVTIEANHPVKGCLLYIGYDDGEEAEWEDNMLDLMPGEKLTVHARGINGRKVLAKWLGSWEL